MSYPKGMKTLPRLLCRVCGEPTKHRISNSNKAILCGKHECREASRLITINKRAAAIRGNPNVSKALKASWDARKGGSSPPDRCRICGEPINLRADSLQAKTRSCNKPECRKASRLMKNEAIKRAAEKRYANGEPRPAGRWHRVATISPVELLIKQELESNGWVHQHKIIPGVKGVHAPRTYHLDFALVEKKLCVEIDGSSHQNKVEKDTKRDRYLTAIGWQTMRLTNKEVRADTNAAIVKILAWRTGKLIVTDPPQLCAWCQRPMVRSKRRRTCSKECQRSLHDESIRGKPGRRGVKNKAISNASYIPCRICGEPTKTAGTPKHPRWGKKACDKPECQAASKLITRQNQSNGLRGNQKLIEGVRAAWDRREGDDRLWPKNRPQHDGSS